MRLSRYEGDSRSGYQTFLHDMRLDIRSNNITGPAQFLVNIAYKTQYKENTLVVQEAIVKSLASAVVGLLKDRLSSIVKSKESFEEDIHERIVQHIREIRNWSQSIQFIDMPSPMNTDEDTVKLNIRTTPRHLRKMSGDFCDETIFLKEPNHYVLLGDPGSGKTTTMKRVVRYFFKDPLTNNDIFNYPLVILLREYDPQTGLLKCISKAIGAKYKDIEEKDKHGKIVKIETVIGTIPIHIALAEILDASNALLILDGLDEVPYTEYTRIVQQINQLANGLDVAKILVTCRSGDFTQTLKGFKILQLNGLTNSQIKEISDNWLENSDRFMEQLEKVPYKDMASSPLLLTQVICIYKFEDELPAEPRLIYRNLLTLLLKEWDRGRGFNRKSKYALFDSDSKLDFLSALSYELTYQIKTITFSESLLIDCYKNICDRHRLPKEEAIEVVREIESHTGIIIVSGKFSFQFSHLSLQEYLCAYYIVREPRAKQIPNYIKEYPAPLAITIALSSNPSIWFADLILKYGEPKYFSQRAIQIFISRLLIEQPRFSTVSALGYAILHLFKNYYEAADNALKEKLDLLLNFPFIVDSLRFAVGQYWILRPLSEEGDVFHLVRQNLGKDKEPGKEYGYPKPGKGLLPKQTLLKIVRNNSVDMYWCDEWGGIGSKFRSTGDDYEYL